MADQLRPGSPPCPTVRPDVMCHLVVRTRPHVTDRPAQTSCATSSSVPAQTSCATSSSVPARRMSEPTNQSQGHVLVSSGAARPAGRAIRPRNPPQRLARGGPRRFVGLLTRSAHAELVRPLRRSADVRHSAARQTSATPPLGRRPPLGRSADVRHSAARRNTRPLGACPATRPVPSPRPNRDSRARWRHPVRRARRPIPLGPPSRCWCGCRASRIPGHR